MHCRWLEDGGFPSVHLSQGGPDASCHMWHGPGQLRAFQRFRGPAGHPGNQLPHFPLQGLLRIAASGSCARFRDGIYSEFEGHISFPCGEGVQRHAS